MKSNFELINSIAYLSHCTDFFEICLDIIFLLRLRLEKTQELENEKAKFEKKKEDLQSEVKGIESNKLVLEKEFVDLQKKLDEIAKKISEGKQSLETSQKELNRVKEGAIAKHEAEVLAMQAEHAARLKAEKEKFNYNRATMVTLMCFVVSTTKKQSFDDLK